MSTILMLILLFILVPVILLLFGLVTNAVISLWPWILGAVLLLAAIANPEFTIIIGAGLIVLFLGLLIGGKLPKGLDNTKK